MLAPATRLAAHVRVTSGRVAAFALQTADAGEESGGTDWLESSARGTVLVLPGVSPSVDKVALSLLTLGADSGTATIEVIDATGVIRPAGHETAQLKPGRVTDVDLSGVFDGAAAAVRVTSEVQVAGGLTLTAGRKLSTGPVPAKLDELALSAPATALPGPVAFAGPAQGTSAALQLTALGTDTSVDVEIRERDGSRVSIRTVELQADTTRRIELGATARNREVVVVPADPDTVVGAGHSRSAASPSRRACCCSGRRSTGRAVAVFAQPVGFLAEQVRQFVHQQVGDQLRRRRRTRNSTGGQMIDAAASLTLGRQMSAEREIGRIGRQRRGDVLHRELHAGDLAAEMSLQSFGAVEHDAVEAPDPAGVHGWPRRRAGPGRLTGPRRPRPCRLLPEPRGGSLEYGAGGPGSRRGGTRERRGGTSEWRGGTGHRRRLRRNRVLGARVTRGLERAQMHPQGSGSPRLAVIRSRTVEPAGSDTGSKVSIRDRPTVVPEPSRTNCANLSVGGRRLSRPPPRTPRSAGPSPPAR